MNEEKQTVAVVNLVGFRLGLAFRIAVSVRVTSSSPCGGVVPPPVLVPPFVPTLIPACKGQPRMLLDEFSFSDSDLDTSLDVTGHPWI